jgi:hypothetical protein
MTAEMIELYNELKALCADPDLPNSQKQNLERTIDQFVLPLIPPKYRSLL